MSAEEGGGGGHGSGWIVTYSDMITLLMTLFIVIVTFGTKQTERYSKKNDSVVGGKGGTGAVGSNSQGADRTAVLVRLTPLGRPVIHGSEAPPIYSDPCPDPIESVLNGFTNPPPGRLSDNYRLRVPTAFLFANEDQLSASGMRALQSFAGAVRQLPYDIQVQVGSTVRIPRGVRVFQYLFEVGDIHPGRIGVSVGPIREGTDEALWLVLTRNR